MVNQHAKLLDTISYEVSLRPRKIDIADMFNILSFSFPYDSVIQKFGLKPNFV